MLAIVAIPSSGTRWRKMSRSRAADNPKDWSRRMAVASPKSIISPLTSSGRSIWPTRAPGAIPETSATASICAGTPISCAVDGPTQTATVIGAVSIASSTSMRRSCETTEPLESTCRISASESSATARSIAPRISVAMISSIRPLTCKTSTTPVVVSVALSLDGPSSSPTAAAEPHTISAVAVAMNMVASLRTGCLR